ncbi:hypothetical protein P154DRAFT_517885 [Amniculicola lignicola CBS 123094]|uniref:P-loop containing nucleoside triphosphate hydrolase protein n=1 Tax=Amniculicola lignicola CBS 123094 TaxID=1392246 RepID=A0A6A5WXA7_9PLEO|nr:hypothetical protein P154DRAFT_517885 [Amniculicola lignicola CBS 123094]
MSWDAFHKKAKLVLPREQLGPKRFWVGILYHDKPDNADFQHEDFLWLKAHGKITVDALRRQYAARRPGVDFGLHFNDQLPQGSAMMKDLNTYNDNTIFFKTTEKSSPVTSAPAQLQMPSETVSQALSGSGPIPAPQKPQGNLNILGTTLTTKSLPGNMRYPLTPISANIDTRTSFHPAEQLHKLSAGAPSHAQTEHTTSSRSAILSTEPLDQSQNPVENPPTSVTYLPPTTNIRPPTMGCSLSHPSHYTTPYPPIGDAFPGRSTPAPLAQHEYRDGPGPPQTECQEVDEKVKAERDMVEPDTQEPDTQESFNLFDPDDVFEKELSNELDDDGNSRPTDTFLRKVMDQQSPEILEIAVSKALKILDHLSCTFSPHTTSSPDAASWVQSIEKLLKMAEQKRTVVGVVGNTGAGKSSVINALLDEERLVPTNCMRACTAVVTEMSWNSSNEPDSKYRAEIEFANPEEWRKEVSALLSEFRTEDRNIVKEISDPNSEAGIAWAKVQAVYPKKPREVFKDITADDLMAEESVLKILGTTKKINAAIPESFYRRLQVYVDSKEKTTGREKDKKKKKKSVDVEYWPLIKVVRIYIRSPALSTGAVIVDLPGVHDSNAARSAVAQNYLKQCTGLWIVAPITRAVDDKSAKTLLGDTFKRQLKYDGGFSGVTFICSKSDDISITEATDSLDLEDEVSHLEAQVKAHKDEIEETEQRIEDLQESSAVYLEAMNTVDAEMDVWDALQEDLEDGKTVYPPVPKCQNRKKQSGSRRTGNRDADDSDEEFIVSDSDTEDEEDDEEDGKSDSGNIEPSQVPLTLMEIKDKIKELKETKKNARRTRFDLEVQIKDLKAEIIAVEGKMKKVKSEINAICIAGRNAYSRGAIQQDFAQGIKELDQENAAEEDEENFNPDEELRDYEEVARSLPVFCVSSRAYQKLCGRLQKDGSVPGFNSKEETEMPQLQAHCKKLTEAGRIRSCRAMLLSFAQHLNTFFMWAASDGSGLKLTDDEKRRESHYIEKRLGELESGMEKAVESCISAALDVMTDQIFSKYPDAINESIRAAPAAVGRWHAPRASGGLAWSTYKAIVRRDGTYTSPSRGPCDFNIELSQPITKRLATGWERAFQHRLPKVFQSYTKNLGQLLHKFHEVVEERARENGVGFAHIQLLANQIDTYEQLFGELQTTLITDMNELQRDANREFTPTIVSLMHAAYEACASEAGQGCFARMKTHMVNYVDTARHQMFTAATTTVRQRLTHMCRALEEKMANKADEIYMSMKRDYMSVLGGATLSDDANKLSKEERTMRSAVKAILFEIDAKFEGLANGQIEEIVDADAEMQDDGEIKDETEMKDGDDDSDFETLHTSTDKVVQKRTRAPSESRFTPSKKFKHEHQMRALSVTPGRKKKNLPFVESDSGSNDIRMGSPAPSRPTPKNRFPTAEMASDDDGDDGEL